MRFTTQQQAGQIRRKVRYTRHHVLQKRRANTQRGNSTINCACFRHIPKWCSFSSHKEGRRLHQCRRSKPRLKKKWKYYRDPPNTVHVVSSVHNIIARHFMRHVRHLSLPSPAKRRRTGRWCWSPAGSIRRHRLQSHYVDPATGTW